MLIHLIAVGKHMPNWVYEGCDTFKNRLPKDYQLKITEIAAEKRTKSANLDQLIQREEAKIAAHIPKDALCIALERTGTALSTKTLANHLKKWHDNNQDICFVIGGPEGLTPQFCQQANAVWSLSELTLPHPLIRVVLAEQIYRAWSIIMNHPYHRE